MKNNEVTDQSIDYLNLSVRTYNCLRRAGIRTIGDLEKKSVSDITRIRGVGYSVLDEIQSKLREVGLSIREE